MGMSQGPLGLCLVARSVGGRRARMRLVALLHFVPYRHTPAELGQAFEERTSSDAPQVHANKTTKDCYNEVCLFLWMWAVSRAHEDRGTRHV